MKWFIQSNNKKKTYATLLVFVLLIGGYLVKHTHTPAKIPVSVSVTSAVRRDLTPQIDTIGTATATNEVDIKSQVSGQLAQIKVNPGQTVKAGDVLFIIDQAPFQALLNQAIATHAKDQASASFSLQQLDRYSRLAKLGYVSKDFFSQIVTNAKSAKALLRADTAAVATAQLMLSHCTIVAPINGRLGDITPNVGDLINANATSPMVSIKQFQPIDVQFSLASKNIGLVRHALNNPDIQVTASATDDSHLRAIGTIDFVDNKIDANTGSIIMKASFANSDSAIWPGELLQIRIMAKTQHQVIVIPTEAISENQQGGFYVYTVDSYSLAHLKNITLGQSVDDVTAVLDGLNVGERVVTSGQFRLSDGMFVKIESGSPAA